MSNGAYSSSEVLRPHDGAAHVERRDLTGAEPGEETLAVGDRRRRGEVVLFVEIGKRTPRLDAVFPEAAAVGSVEGFDDEKDRLGAGAARRAGLRSASRRETSAASSRASCGWARRSDATRPTCDVTKIRSPQTIGDDDPSPRSAALHAMFSRALHVIGRPDSADTPSPDGPRHCGQFAAIGAAASRTSELTSAAHLRRWFPRMGET